MITQHESDKRSNAFCEILELIQLSITHTETFINDRYTPESFKPFARNSILRRLNDIKLAIFKSHPESRQPLKDLIFNDEAAMQQHEIMIQVRKLNKQQRDDVESYIGTLQTQK